jgi:Ankyrin repeats (3 copies)
MLPHLKAPQLESVVQKAQHLGFTATGDAIRRALIVPFSIANKLPGEAFVDWYHKRLRELEQTLNWSVFEGYLALLKFVQKRGKQDRVAWRGVAVVVESLLRYSEGPPPQYLDGSNNIFERRYQKLLWCLREILVDQQEIAFRAITLLRPLYEKQHREEEFKVVDHMMPPFTRNSSHEITNTTSLSNDFGFQGDTDILGWTEEKYTCLKRWLGRSPVDYETPDCEILGPADITGQSILHYLAAEVNDDAWNNFFPTRRHAGQMKTRGRNGQLPIHRAALRGNERAVLTLLILNNDPNQTDYAGRSLLSLTAWNGHEKVVALLLKNELDVNQPDKWGATALHFAAFRGWDTVVKKLI